MAADDDLRSESAGLGGGVAARPGWSVGSRVTAVLAVVTLALVAVHVWWPVPVWVVWVAGGLTLAAFVAAVIHRWRRSVALEEDLF